MPHTMGAREWVLIVLLSVLWGGSFFFVGVAVGDLAPLTIVTLRVGLAAVALWAVGVATGLRPRRVGGHGDLQVPRLQSTGGNRIEVARGRVDRDQTVEATGHGQIEVAVAVEVGHHRGRNRLGRTS